MKILKTNQVALVKSLIKTPQTLRVKLKLNKFLLNYFAKFSIKKIGNYYIIHSHLPAINSDAHKKFITRHLIGNTTGPSHAQIGLTNACHQNCSYCYNKSRAGKPMNKATILKAIKELGEMGVVWLGLTGGEPLLNKDIVEIIDRTDKNIAIKLFTTGYKLTKQQAIDMKNAGLSYVSVSLDSQSEDEHDRNRGYKGAFRDALKSIEIFLESGLHTSVSSVLTREMMTREKILEFMDFLEDLKVHEAWLSEVKPSLESYWHENQVIRDEEISMLLNLQDEYNRKNKMTLNYLGHFENKKYFGCNAGNKMIYIDAFGEVSPCVFTPMTFGNITEKPLVEICNLMRDHFKAGSTCYINKNYGVISKHFRGETPISPEDSVKIVKESFFPEIPEFHKLMNR